MVVFNLQVTHAARFALKTTTAFNEEPKKEKLAGKAEENGRIIAKNSRFSGKNGAIFCVFLLSEHEIRHLRRLNKTAS